MISGVMRLADRSARGLMTPRLDVEVIDLADDPDEIRKTILTSPLAPAGAGWRRRLVIGVIVINPT